MSETVAAMAMQLREYATHFVSGDWDYTREHDIRHIRMRGDWSGYDHPVRRVVRLVKGFARQDPIGRELFGTRVPFSWRHPIIHVTTCLRTESHEPDGVLDGGAVIVHWEETGEYLQYVQPSVGVLLADLMDAHPNLPEVQALAAEMKRIDDRYGERIEDTTGCANYKAPTTCLTAPSSETGRCDHCRMEAGDE